MDLAGYPEGLSVQANGGKAQRGPMHVSAVRVFGTTDQMRRGDWKFQSHRGQDATDMSRGDGKSASHSKELKSKAGRLSHHHLDV